MDSKALAARLSKKYDTRDPFRLADEMGFIVVFAPLVGMRGFQQRIKRQNIIYINDELDERQQALVCGHEMGHHFMHRGMNRIFMNLNTQFVTQKFENEAHQRPVPAYHLVDHGKIFFHNAVTLRNRIIIFHDAFLSSLGIQKRQ